MGDLLNILSSQRIKEKNYPPLQKINWEKNGHPYIFVHEKIYYLYIFIYIYITGLDQLVNDEFH